MSTLKIAFIDDGINKYYVPKNQKFESYIVYDNSVKVGNVSTDHFGHANLCYRIFHDHVRVPYHLISIKILDGSTSTGNKYALAAALNWCADREIDIIHMSVGTQQYQDFSLISNAVLRLTQRFPTIIVAACNNENTLTIPACLSNVIGVRHCPKRSLQGIFAYNSSAYDQIEVLTCVDNLHVFHGGKEIIEHGTNSLAVPFIAAHICSYISQGLHSINEIRTALKKKSMAQNSLFTHAFYRSLLLKWEKICTPLIAVPDYSHISTVQLKKIINDFIQQDYRAICLSRMPWH